MNDKILTLHKTPEQTDIIRGLRALADRLEQEGAEAYDMPLVTTCVCVLGHTTKELLANGEIVHETWSEVFGWGPRNDAFSVRGLLATAIRRR